MEGAVAATLTGPLRLAAPGAAPVQVVIHRQFNPEGRSATNIVPGLLAIIMSMTMVMITAVAIVRDVPYTQATAYPESGPFPASAHEDALDKATMLIHTSKPPRPKPPKPEIVAP